MRRCQVIFLKKLFVIIIILYLYFIYIVERSKNKGLVAHRIAMGCIISASILRLLCPKSGTKDDGEEETLQVEQNNAILQRNANFIQCLHTL